MATKAFRGDAVAVAQVNTITPATVTVGNTFTVAINGKAVTYTAAATTVADVVAGLSTLLIASTIPEFTDVTWAAVSTTAISATAKTAGKPFTQTSSAATGGGSGTPTLVTATTVTSSGPNDWSVAASFSASGVPASSDTVGADDSASDILYGLAQSAVTLTQLDFPALFGGNVGLPHQATADGGGTYYEYRNTDGYLAIGVTTLNVGRGSGNGLGRLKLNTGSVATTQNIFTTGAATDSNLPAVLLKGSNAANVLNVLGGTVGVALFEGETAQYTTLKASGGSVECGSGVTLATVDVSQDANATLACGATTITKEGTGKLTMLGSGAIGTSLTVNGGTVDYQGTGTIAALNVVGTIDFSNGTGAVTVTACTAYKGAVILDPHKRVTWSAGIVLSGCDLTDVDFQLGLGRTIGSIA